MSETVDVSGRVGGRSSIEGAHSARKLVNSRLTELLGGGVFRYIAVLDKIIETLFDKMHEHPFVLGRWERAPPLPYCRAELPVPRRALGWWVALNAEPRKALQQIDFPSSRAFSLR